VFIQPGREALADILTPAGLAELVDPWCRVSASVWILEDGERRLEAPPKR